MKIANLGKKLCIILILLAFLVSTLFVIIINFTNRNVKDNSAQFAKDKISNINTIRAEEIYYDTQNYWPKEFVSNIVDENVPIPKGFNYQEGNKESGIIIKDENEEKYFLWIPYDKDVTTEKMDEYFTNCEYKGLNIDDAESIKHYGGFYINITDNDQYDLLKSITNEQYEAGEKNAKKSNDENDNVNSNLVSKEELAQIISYKNKIGDSLKDVTTGVFATTINTYTTLNSQNSTLQLNGINITIPSGFQVLAYSNENRVIDKATTGFENNLVIKIKDIENPNLVYVWVPVNEDANNLKQKLADIYSSVKVENESMYMYNWEAEDPYNDTEYQNLLNSIKEYGGFYVGESELGYDINGTITNRARGMKKDSDGNLGIYNGEYYRGSNENSNTIEKMKLLADVYSNGNKTSVKSHLTYGIEWDAISVWIASGNVSAENICKNSTNLESSKYNVNLSNEILDEEISGINGIYGLAGNLVDMTQEVKKFDETSSSERKTLDFEYLIGRGGSYNDAGDTTKGGYPISSRMTLTDEEIKEKNIGFRNCLYIVTGNENNNITSLSNALVIGDSISSYMRKLFRQEGATVYNQSGENAEFFLGKTPAQTDERYTTIKITETCKKGEFFNWNEKMSSVKDTNVIIIFLGQNLTAYGEAIADMGLGDIQELIDKLKNEFPNVPIYINSVVPMSNKNEADYKLYMSCYKYVVDGIKKIAEKNNNVTYMNTLDGYIDENGDALRNMTFLDGLHPSEEGQTILLKNIKREIIGDN